MGYIGSSRGSGPRYNNQSISTPRYKAPEPDKIEFDLDPSSPADAVFGGIGKLFSGAVAGGMGVANALSNVPVIGDVGKAVAGGLGAFGEVGIKGIAQVKDVAKVGLDIVSLPGKAVQAGAAAVRLSGVFGEAPADAKNMMNNGKSFADVVGYLTENNRGFSDDAMTNLGFSLITDPLNYVNPAAPILSARHASKFANIEKVAIAKADEVLSASKAGRAVAPEYASMVGKRPGDLRKEMLLKHMDKDDIDFLNRWRIAGSLYDATLGKAGRAMNSVVDAARGLASVGMMRSFGDTPRNLLEGLDEAGFSKEAAAYASSIGRGLVQSTVFSVSRLFARTEQNLGRLRAQAVLNRVQAGVDNAIDEATTAERLVKDGLASNNDTATALIARVKGMDDRARRQFVREIADEWTSSQVKSAGAQAGGNYSRLMEIGGIRMADTIDETTSFLSEGSRRYATMAEDALENLFVEKSRAAMSPNGRNAVSRMLGGEVVTTGNNADAALREIFRKGSKGDKKEMAKLVHLSELAAYGAQATSAATVRSLLRSAAAGNKANVEEIIGKPVTLEAFNKLKELLATDAGKKLLRMNLVRANVLTEDRITAILNVADSIRSGQKTKAALLSAFPDDMREGLATAKTLDELAQVVTAYFPDISVNLGKASSSEWSSLKSILEDVLESGSFVTLATADEVAELRKVLDSVAPGSGRAVEQSLAAGRYSLGFAPEAGILRRPVSRATDDGVEIFDEPVAPFIDNTDDYIEGMEMGVDAFKASGLRRLANRWLRPVSSGMVQQNQMDNAIDVVLAGGGSISQAKTLFNAINELALRRRVSPRALVMDENALRQVMQDALGSRYDDVVRAADKRLKDPRKVLMKIYAGDRATVGVTQAFTGRLKVMRPSLAIITDFIYPQLKFKLNPLFYLQEAIESPFFNYLRGIQRQITGGEYEVVHGWAKYLPFAKTRVGRTLGLSRAVGPETQPEIAALLLGAGDSAIKADLDIAEAVIFLQGSQAAKILDQTESGRLMISTLKQSISRGASDALGNWINPYPLKNRKKLEMTFSLAAEEVANKIRFEFPQQWVAMTATYGTNKPKMVMAYLLQDAARGWVNPIKVIDGARPRNFAFAGPGSVEKANALRDELAKVAEMPIGGMGENEAARKALFSIREKSLAESAAVGNEVTNITSLIQRAINAGETDDVASILKSASQAADDAARMAAESTNDFRLLDEAIVTLTKSGDLKPGAFGGFSREKISASLARHRSYGTDFPGMEMVIGKLRSGSKLDVTDIRALELGMNTLLDVHGPEEVLLEAMRVSLRNANDSANRIHFYNPKRSAFERSLNHPYLAFYPLSYMIGKVVPEFSRALFVKFPFTNATRPFAGYEWVHEIQDFIAMKAEEDPAFAEALLKSDILFLFKQLFPGVPGDIGVTAPRWVNRYYAQIQRSQRPPMPGREPASADIGYGIRAIADQAKDQGLFGNIELAGGAATEFLDWFGGAVDFNESGK